MTRSDKHSSATTYRKRVPSTSASSPTSSNEVKRENSQPFSMSHLQRHVYSINQYGSPRSSSVGGVMTEELHDDDNKETIEIVAGKPPLDPQNLPSPDPTIQQFNPQLRLLKLVLIQQPIRARMCGSSDRDWRPVSPPPVLRLELYNMQGQPIIDHVFMQNLVLHTTLWTEDCEEELTVVELPQNTNSKRISAAAKSRKRGVTTFGNGSIKPGLEIENNLLGDYSASSSIVEDDHGEYGCYFVFPNLSIRLEGRYKLRFNLIKLPNLKDTLVPTNLATTFSDPFDVYSIKTFPGMIESTMLSRALAQQGIKIPIRNTQEGHQ